jgi:hypothetical protein
MIDYHGGLGDAQKVRRAAHLIRKAFPRAVSFDLSSSDQVPGAGYDLCRIDLNDGSWVEWAQPLDSWWFDVDDLFSTLSWGYWGDGDEDSRLTIDVFTLEWCRRDGEPR